MPIYAYKCTSCGHTKDVLQKMSDAPLTVCPACGGAHFQKQLTAAGFQLKGSGWYVTDFRNGNAGAAAPAHAKADGAGDAKTDGDGKAASESKTAPAQAASPSPAPATAAKPAASPAPSAPAAGPSSSK